MWVRNAESNQCALVSVSAVIRARGRLVVVEAWILIAVIGGRALRQRRRRHDHHQRESAEYRFHSIFSFASPASVNGPARRRFRRFGAMQFCYAAGRENV